MSDTFECGCESVDATSDHRPDTDWRHVDSQGHEHRWHDSSSGQPAQS